MTHLILISKGGMYWCALFSGSKDAIKKAVELRNQGFTVFGPSEQPDKSLSKENSPLMIMGHDEAVETLISPLVREIARGIIEQQVDTDDYDGDDTLYDAAYHVCVDGLLNIGFPDIFAQKIADEAARNIAQP